MIMLLVIIIVYLVGCFVSLLIASLLALYTDCLNFSDVGVDTALGISFFTSWVFIVVALITFIGAEARKAFSALAEAIERAR